MAKMTLYSKANSTPSAPVVGQRVGNMFIGSWGASGSNQIDITHITTKTYAKEVLSSTDNSAIVGLDEALYVEPAAAISNGSGAGLDFNILTANKKYTVGMGFLQNRDHIAYIGFANSSGSGEYTALSTTLPKNTTRYYIYKVIPSGQSEIYTNESGVYSDTITKLSSLSSSTNTALTRIRILLGCTAGEGSERYSSTIGVFYRPFCYEGETWFDFSNQPWKTGSTLYACDVEYDVGTMLITSVGAVQDLGYLVKSLNITSFTESRGTKNSSGFGAGTYLRGGSSIDALYASYDRPITYKYMYPAFGPPGMLLFIPLGKTTGTTSVNGCTAIDGRRPPRKCYSFDGVDDYISLGNSADLKPQTAFSVSLWVKPGATQVQYADILSCHSNGYCIEQNSTNTNQYSWGFSYAAGSFRSSGNFNLTANVWSHLACVWDGSTLKTYINGSFVTSGDGTGPIYYDSADVCLGRWGSGGGRFWNGCMEQFGIYKTALTTDEITDLYNETAYPYFYQDVALVPSKLGYRPGNTQRHKLSSAGTYYITRTDEKLSIWASPYTSSTDYAASVFGLVAAPNVVAFRIAGGGAGGGGASGSADGGGGGGGGVAVGFIRVPTTTTYSQGAQIIIGTGGGGGAGGTGSNNQDGGAGGTSRINLGSSYIILNGGSPGEAAKNNSDGGAGGSVAVSIATGDEGKLGTFQTSNGGNGGAKNSSSTGLNFTTSIAPEFSLSTSSTTTGTAYGGGSIGNGGPNKNNGTGYSGSEGGGGSGGDFSAFDGHAGGAGGAGVIYIYY